MMTENEKKIVKILTKEGLDLGPKYTYEIAKKIVQSLSLPSVIERDTLDKMRVFISEQKPLPPDMQKIINENFWDLI